MTFAAPTTKERALIRDAILRGEAGGMDVFYACDGTWAAEIETPAGPVYLEAESAAAVLRRVAEVLEEA